MCPPIVANGSWHCSNRRPLPDCSLFCHPGLVPLQTSQVNCEIYRQDNSTAFSCVKAAALVLGGLDNNDQPITSVEMFSNERATAVFSELGMRHGSTLDWYNGTLMTCGGLYKRNCFSHDQKSQANPWIFSSKMSHMREGASSSILEQHLEVWGGIDKEARKTSETYSTSDKWQSGIVASEDTYESCTSQINASHTIISGGQRNPGWMSIVTSRGEVTRVKMEEPIWGHGCVTIPGGVLLAGGNYSTGNSSIISSKSWIFTFDTEKWEETDNMNHGRTGFSHMILLDHHVWAFGGLTMNGVTDSIERFNLETKKWENFSKLSEPRAGHAVTSVPTEVAFKDANPPISLHPTFSNPVVDGLDLYHGAVTIALIQLPCLFVSTRNILKSIGRRQPSMVIRSLAIVIIPFPFIQTLIVIILSFLFQKFPETKRRLEVIATSILNPILFQKVKDIKDSTHVQEMKAEVDMAGTFFNSCPSICLQVLLLIYFPDRRVNWPQYFSIPVSAIMILWTASNLFVLQIGPNFPGQNTIEGISLIEKIIIGAREFAKKLKTFIRIVPITSTSIMFNYIVIILTILNGYFTIYVLVAFISIFLPATFSPFKSVAELEKSLGLLDDNDEEDGKRTYSKINITRAIYMSLVNLFCHAHPLKNETPSLRQFTVGIYPLHFVVNITTLLLIQCFSTTSEITVNGIILNITLLINMALVAGVLNLVLLIFYYYPRILTVAVMSMKNKNKKHSYSMKKSCKKSEKEANAMAGYSFRQDNS